jgi:hypothetical protein
MNKTLTAIAVAAAVAGCTRRNPRLADIGPRMVSNETAFPVYLYGEALPRAAKLKLGEPWNATVDTVFIDAGHLAARLPSGPKLPPETTSVDVVVSLVQASGEAVPGSATLTVVNDVGFPGPIAAVVSGNRLVAAVPETDELWVYSLGDGTRSKISVGDGPCALALHGTGPSQRVAVVDRYDGDLWLVDVANPSASARKLNVGVASRGIAIFGDRAYVSDEAESDLAVVDLKSGSVVQRIAAGVGPGPVAVGMSGKRVAVGNQETDDVSVVYTKDMSALLPISPRPGVSIIGGRTEKYRDYVIGGKAPRDLAVYGPGTVFEASVGPNVGPNPDKMEVSMNPGIGVLDVSGGRFLRHVSAGYGTLSGLALDEPHKLLYASDEAAGRVLVFSAEKLRESDETAKTALLGQIVLEPDEGAPNIRPLPDLSDKGRAGPSVASGPKAIALSSDATRLYAVSRYTGSVWELDVAQAAKGTIKLLRRFRGTDGFAQKERRLGQIIYYSDLGKVGMTCDSCHFEGHTDGVLFAKTHPLRLYRVPTLRWIRESPPYFNPPNRKTLEDTASYVLARNRFQNPPPSNDEIKWLALYTKLLVGLPNPYVGRDGAPPAELTLRDGRPGHPAKGMGLFADKGGCASSACHPAPIFTADENPETRGATGDVGTPPALPIRTELQDLRFPGVAPPALLGIWDVFPLYSSGAGGFAAKQDTLYVADAFALRAALQMSTRVPHGHAKDLSPEEMDDLLAYLLTL